MLTSQDDDDDNTLFLLPGGDGELVNKRTGEVVGQVRGGVLMGSALPFMGSGTDKTQWYLKLGATNYDSSVLGDLADIGGQEALAQGFDVTVDADDNAWGGEIAIGVLCGDEGLWGQKGSVLWNFELAYAQYEEQDAVITGTQELGSVISQSQSEISTLGISFGPHMYVADGLALYGRMGYTWVETEDQGNIRQVSPDGSQSIFLNSFSEEDVDGTATFTLGASYDMTESLSLYAAYTMALDDVGPGEGAQFTQTSLGMRMDF